MIADELKTILTPHAKDSGALIKLPAKVSADLTGAALKSLSESERKERTGRVIKSLNDGACCVIREELEAHGDVDRAEGKIVLQQAKDLWLAVDALGA